MAQLHCIAQAFTNDAYAAYTQDGTDLAVITNRGTERSPRYRITYTHPRIPENRRQWGETYRSLKAVSRALDHTEQCLYD